MILYFVFSSVAKTAILSTTTLTLRFDVETIQKSEKLRDKSLNKMSQRNTIKKSPKPYKNIRCLFCNKFIIYIHNFKRVQF